MAIQKIEYQNKVSIQDDPSVPEINKVTDSNMNEIKSVVNNNAGILIDVQDEIGDIGTTLDTIQGEVI